MDIRNIAIIAHVDHGKTTLIDVLLRQSGTFRANQRVAERAMDSNDLERERGITILAKCTSLSWKDTQINIVDTPGHADFGGEVERTLDMVDGAIVLVDAAEGPMPQTKFVVSKALAAGLKPIVAVNKIDKSDERHGVVVDAVFDLFAALDANEAQLDFPILYGSAKEGWMAAEPSGPRHDGMGPLFDLVLAHVAPPKVEEGPFRMLATMLEADPYLGRMLTGRILSGTIKANDTLKALARDGSKIEEGRVTRVLAFRGLERQPIEEGRAGDIVAIAGLSRASVADTLCAPEATAPLEARPIDPPTLSMTFRINDGPFAGQEGDKVQSRVIRERLLGEAEGNVALRIEETEDTEALEVFGRGELQLAILIETMRREGFELTVSRPRVVYRTEPETGRQLEPVEEVIIDVDEEFSGAVVSGLAERRGDLVEMNPSGRGRQRLVFHVPTRGLIGYHGELLSSTRGTAIMNRIFLDYVPHRGSIESRRTGVLIANGEGRAVPYALFNLEDRGPLMVGPGTRVYRGMIVGAHSRGRDIEVNVLRAKKLTNIRAAGKDENVVLTPPMILTLEKALAYIAEDELVEITPENIRLRKRHLDSHERKRAARRARTADAV